MKDISIDEARAKMWIQEVDEEIRDVEALLRKINQAASSIPGEDDDIMKGIEATCNTLNDFWTKMCNGFKSAGKSLTSVIDSLGKAASSVIEDINAVKSKIGS